MRAALSDIRQRTELIEAFVALDCVRVDGLRAQVAFGECLGTMVDGLARATLFGDEAVEDMLISAALDDSTTAEPARGLPGAGPIFLWGLPALKPCGLAHWLADNLDNVHAAGPLPFMPMALEETLGEYGLNLWTVQGLRQALKLYPRRLAEAYLLASSNHRGEKPAFVDSLPQSLLVAPLLHQVFPDSRILMMRGSQAQEVAALVGAGLSADEATRRQTRYARLADQMQSRLGSACLRVSLNDIDRDAPEALARIARHLGYRLPDRTAPLPDGWPIASLADARRAS